MKPAAVALLSVLAAAGCARERDPLGNPIDGTHRVTTFAVIDGKSQTVWKMSAPPPGVRSAEDVVYGRVPAGFTQGGAGGRRAPADDSRR